ncbi:MAG: hypothetical protein KAJ49_03975 [Arcobacteraceae bacterium]|nr:hypothetical protein [Arcobacteraceae bacterium]
MVINISSVKTEALLLFCRDLINSYRLKDDNIFNIDDELKIFVSKHIDDLQKAINVIVQPNDYYIRNMRVDRIKIIVKYYNSINQMVSKHLEQLGNFNPSMLCFSLLATWFKELDHETSTKEFLYFGIYPYGEIYDSLLINVTDVQYKRLNITMIQIAEDVMIKLNKE